MKRSLTRRLIGTAICLVLWPFVSRHLRVEIYAELERLWPRRDRHA